MKMDVTTALQKLPVQTQGTEKASSSRYSEAELQKIKKACADFESLFTYELLKTMRKTVPETKTGMGNYGKDTFTMIIDQKLSENISATDHGLGLKKVLFEQITKTGAMEAPEGIKNKLK
ncbi:MAG TPA: rod-binding protein [Smithellaceae bacterium]|jgi:peptidoglycan hydrolase FlgJ|nr:rod-binding protein [Smithellaceae bacterium]HQM45042.1 rod-binding protein [Smithellaceae bacterium]